MNRISFGAAIKASLPVQMTYMGGSRSGESRRVLVASVFKTNTVPASSGTGMYLQVFDPEASGCKWSSYDIGLVSPEAADLDNYMVAAAVCNRAQYTRPQQGERVFDISDAQSLTSTWNENPPFNKIIELRLPEGNPLILMKPGQAMVLVPYLLRDNGLYNNDSWDNFRKLMENRDIDEAWDYLQLLFSNSR